VPQTSALQLWRPRIVPNESDGTVDIYDGNVEHPWLRLAPDGPQRAKLKFMSASFSAGGSAVALKLNAGGDMICVVDLARGRVRAHRFRYPTKDLKYELADDGALVVASPDGRLYFSDAETGHLMEGGQGNVLPYLAMSPDGMWFATAGVRDGTVRLWSRSGDYSEYKLPYWVEHLKFSSNGKELLAGSASSVHSWVVPSAEGLRNMGIAPAQPTAKKGVSEGSHLADSGVVALLYNNATGAWIPIPDHSPNREAELTSPIQLARVLASGNATPEQRLAAARSLAQMRAADTEAIGAAVGALRTALKYPAIVIAVVDYIRSVPDSAQPILSARLQAEKNPQIRSALLWAAAQVYSGTPEVQAVAHQGLTSQNPDFRLMSARVVADLERNPQTLSALLAAFLNQQDSALVPRDDVRHLVLKCEPDLVAQALEKLNERDEAGAIRLVGNDWDAAPILQRLATARLRPLGRTVFAEAVQPYPGDLSADWRQRTLAELRNDSGTESCRKIDPYSVVLLHGLKPGPEPELPAIAKLVLDKAEKDPTSRICLNALALIGPDGGIPLARVLHLLERVSASLQPLSYGITDVIVEDLEDEGIPVDVIKLLRAGVQDEWEERSEFERRMRDTLGEEVWTKFGAQIIAAAGKPRTKECDARTNTTAAAIGAIGAYGTAASEAEQPLRAMAEKYRNCTDVVPAIAKALNEISGVSKPSSHRL
jgi:hypothetical protein